VVLVAPELEGALAGDDAELGYRRELAHDLVRDAVDERRDFVRATGSREQERRRWRSVVERSRAQPAAATVR